MIAYLKRFLLLLCLAAIVTLGCFLIETVIVKSWNFIIAVQLPVLSRTTYYVIFVVVLCAIFAFRKS